MFWLIAETYILASLLFLLLLCEHTRVLHTLMITHRHVIL